MIYARGIDISQFPDGTPHLKENPSITMDGFVSWHYRCIIVIVLRSL